MPNRGDFLAALVANIRPVAVASLDR